MIDRILAADPGPKIILLHSDHGGGYLAHEDRMKILNAYYFSDGNYGSLYPAISPVNSFRLILKEYFGAEDMGLLKERSFWSGPEKGIFDFEEVPVEA
jgi:hypothetical protein